MNSRYRSRKIRRIYSYLSLIMMFSALAFIVAWFENHNREIISARFLIVDGDSLRYQNQRIRLVGIDAPELSQICGSPQGDYRCGIRARDYLKELAEGTQVQCYGEGEDKYRRLLAECYSGKDSLNAQLVAAGWAVSYGGYGAQEKDARTSKRGLWAGTFDMPQNWRAIHSAVVENPTGRIWRSIWRRIKYRFLTVEIEPSEGKNEF